ncbi:MAG: hypothetical protein K0U41_08030 [Gammaproteobacteria bacterium]|nr:hypothetical protein [Gammaproteobacteria bacterium]
MLKFATAMLATFGIMITDLPALIVYQLIIIVVSTIFSWSKHDTEDRTNWKGIFGAVALAQFIGIITFASDWDSIYILKHLPLPAIAAVVGYSSCHISVLFAAIVKRIGGGK